MMSNVLRNELPQYIKNQNIRVDYLFITGDFRDSLYKKEFDEDTELAAEHVAKYIIKIAESLGILRENIYLVPGNHDLNRGKDDQEKELEKEMIGKIIPQYLEYKDGLREEEKKYLQNRFDYFYKVYDYIHPKDDSWRENLHQYVEKKEFDILLLNSAITCNGKEQEGELLLDTMEVEKVMRKSYLNGTRKPLFVLAHHKSSFLKRSEQEGLMELFKNRKVYYLCGHSHKLMFHYDDEYNMWEIMVGTTKKEEGSAPIFSIGETTINGNLSSLKFYKYDFIKKGRWIPYKKVSVSDYIEKLEFVGKDYRIDTKDESHLIQLSMVGATSSTPQDRSETIETLKKLKYKLRGRKEENTLTILTRDLPAIACIVIGYQLHRVSDFKLFYQTGTSIYTNSISENRLQFTEEIPEIQEKLVEGKEIDLCIYIQAKEIDGGIRTFHNYMNTISKNGRSHRYSLILKNKETYHEDMNLEGSASYLSGRIIEEYEAIRNKYNAKVNVHLFYNGFFGLAILLGNQLPTTFPIQLYDFDMNEQEYTPSFLLCSSMK